MADGFSIAWDGLKAFTGAFDRLSAEADLAAKEIVTKGAAMVEKAAKANFEGSHDRKVHGHVGGGDKPNVVTGDLRRSIRADPVVRTGAGAWATRVYPRMVYARRVELGWNGKGKYPYFTPGYDQVKPQIEALARATWAAYLH